MRRASWSFALKSAAVSVANAVGSNFGCSPTVATSCPVRSTRSAQRALQSVRNRSNERVMAPKSSSVNDQLVEPTAIRVLGEVILHASQQLLAAPPERRVSLPSNVVGENPKAVGTRPTAEVPERGQPTHPPGAEQVPAGTAHLRAPN